MADKDEELESKQFELRALRNRARKRRSNKEFDLAKRLYSQAIEVAKELKSDEEVEKLEKIVQKVELDLLVQRLDKIEQDLTQLN